MSALNPTSGTGDFSPIRQENVERFKNKVNAYEERGFSWDKAINLAANGDLPYLRKRLRQDYAQFLIDFYKLKEDTVQQRILESAETFKNQHDMNQTDSIRQAIKLRKDLSMDVWPNHNIETKKASEDQEDYCVYNAVNRHTSKRISPMCMNE